LIEWILFLFFILKYGEKDSILDCLKYPTKNWGWNILAIFIGLIPLPIFLKFNYLLTDWTIWLPWIILVLINPWLEEFYWRELLSDYTKHWKTALSILFTSVVFSANQAVFGINSDLFKGYTVVISTLIIGIVGQLPTRKPIV